MSLLFADVLYIALLLLLLFCFNNSHKAQSTQSNLSGCSYYRLTKLSLQHYISP